MRLSASRIRSINRRLARAQGYTWPAHNTTHSASSASVAQIRTVKIVAVPKSAAA